MAAMSGVIRIIRRSLPDFFHVLNFLKKLCLPKSLSLPVPIRASVSKRPVSSGFKETVGRAVRTALALRRATANAGYRLSVGVAPGVARIQPETHRPGDGWELAGPFYLARWMMNLSAHRSRVLLTEVGARQVEEGTTALGRIPIQGNKYINLYEVG